MSRRLRILLVEDHEPLRRTLCTALEASGHAVIAGGDGAFGLRLIEHYPVDLVVTDIVMPGTDGMEVLRALRRMPFAPPVIAISGGGSANFGEYLEVAAQLGAQETLVKPFAVSELLAAITRIMDRTRVAQEDE